MSLLRRGTLTARNYSTVLSGAAHHSGYPNPSPITIPDRPTAAYYDELVNVAGRHGDFDTLRNLLNKRMRDGFFNTNDTFKFVTATESSLSTLDDLLQTLTRLDQGITRKNAFDTLIARLCKIGRVHDALRVAEAMLGGACSANAVTLHPILCALTRQRDMESAWRVVEAARERDVLPDVTAYNYFLTAYCVTGDLHSAAQMLDRMVVEGMAADTRTYDALVLGSCRAGKVEGALAILRRMAEEEVPALYSTHTHVVKAMLKSGYCAQAVDFVRSCSGGDRALETESFGILANELIKLKRFGEAKSVLEDMAGRGLRMGEKLSNFYDRITGGPYQKLNYSRGKVGLN